MPTYSYESIIQADRSWRINFINCLIGPKNLHLLVTRNLNGTYNAAIFNSGLHIGSSPPYVGFLLRPTTVPRHTYENLMHYPFATMNAVSSDFYERAHATHIKLPYGESEIGHCGLTPQWEENEDLPYIAESPLKARLRFVEEHLLAINQTRLTIFAVEKVHISKEPDPDGFVRLDELQLVGGSGCDAYWSLVYLGRQPLNRRG